MPDEYAVIGKPVPRVDAAVKTTGEAQYAADLVLPGMLWAKTLHSPHPHARILNVDTSRAEKLPGVRAVVTGRDAVGGAKYGLNEATRDKRALEFEKVRYIGDELAAVAAIDTDIAEEALELMKVDYEPLPAVFDPEETLKPDAPRIHEHLKDNITAETHMEFGDAARGFADSDEVREEKFVTQFIVHGFIEPHAALATWDHTGRATIWASKQSPYIAFRHLARGLGIPLGKLRIIQPYVGGGFGGKHEPYGNDFAALLLARKTGRPVKCVYDQEEVFMCSRRRHEMRMTMKMGVTRDGTIKAVHLQILADGGAYASVGPLSIFLPGGLLPIPIHMQSFKYDAQRVYTNKPYAGALMGQGLAQARFAFEQMVDIMAEAIGMDALELRMRNAMKPGDISINGMKIHTTRFIDTMMACTRSVDWAGRRGKRFRDGSKVRGVGMGCNPGLTGTRMGSHDGSAALLKVHEDGMVTLFGGYTDAGQGADTVLGMMVAESLGIDLNEVNVAHVDSDITPVDPGTYGSRTTFCSGRAVVAACENLKRQLAEFVAEKLEANPEDLEFREHKVFVRGSPEKFMPLLQAIRGIYYGQGKPLMAHASVHSGNQMVDYSTGLGDVSAAYSSGTQAAEVEVDTETGKVRVVKMAIAHDCGQAINPRMVEGQQHGPSVSGQGKVLFEETPYDKGLIMVTNLLDYGMPSALDTNRDIETFHIDAADPVGPFGAKDAGEGAQIAALPAIANAIYDAVGIRLTRLPITPEAVLRALAEKAKAEKGDVA